jgi:diguanylate cyclase (GGDEF)-like protein
MESTDALPGAARPSGWRVRSHLLGIAAAVVLVSVVVGSFAAVQAFRRGERDVRRSARYYADTAADAIASSYAAGRAQVVALAGNPKVVDALDDPTGCQLNFDLLLLPGSRIDLVRPDGAIVCSSEPVRGTPPSHASAAWLGDLRPTSPVHGTGPFRDARSGQAADGIVGVVPGPDGSVAGAVVVVVLTDPIGSQVAEVNPGPRHFDFAVLASASGAVASTSDGWLLDEADRTRLRTDGVLSGSSDVGGTPWRVVAALPRGRALAGVRSTVRAGVLVVVAMLVTLLVALAVVHRRIARPLRELTDAVDLNDPLAREVLGGLHGPREVKQLAARFDVALAAHADYEAQLSHQALHDTLTGLPNRALLTDRLRQALGHAERTDERVCVVFIDLDHFKLINDGLGHAIGDLVLVAAAQRLTSILRRGDTVARFGGDEFVLVGRDLDDAEAAAFADRALRSLDDPIAVGDAVVRVTASAGIAVGGPSSDSAALLRDADAAMYLAKERGRSRHEAFNEDLRDRARSRLTMETELRTALDRRELHLVHQPKVDLATGMITGVESLLRWEHPALGSVSPATFIPIAEDTGLIVPIGRFVLDEACRQAARWRQQGFDLDVSLNVSGRQLADDGLPAAIAASLHEHGIEAGRLCIELTESVLMDDTRRTAGILDAIDALGVQVSIDDFGTGYSSLAYLHRFPVDELKIDRSFVGNVTDDPQQQTLVTAMIAMADALGLRTVAEGIETAEQRRVLLERGCHLGQGYFFARPQSAAALETMLLDRARILV